MYERFCTWLRFESSEFLELGNGLSEVEIDAKKMELLLRFFAVAVFEGYKGKERKIRGVVVFSYEKIYFKRGRQIVPHVKNEVTKSLIKKHRGVHLS